MAEPHAHSQPIETYGRAPRPQPTNRNIWPSAHNRNIWPHNSRATAAPSRLADSFVLQLSVYPLLTCFLTFVYYWGQRFTSMALSMKRRNQFGYSVETNSVTALALDTFKTLKRCERLLHRRGGGHNDSIVGVVVNKI